MAHQRCLCFHLESVLLAFWLLVPMQASNIRTTKTPIDVCSWVILLHKKFSHCTLAKQFILEKTCHYWHYILCSTTYIAKRRTPVRLQRIGRVYCNKCYRTISGIFHLKHEHRISTSTLLTFPSCTVRKWLPLTCFITVLLLNFLQKGETWQESSTGNFVMCIEMPAWVPAVSKGG